MSKPTKADRDGADGPAGGPGNRIEVDGLGEFYVIDNVKVVATRPAGGGKGKRVALLVESPALAVPAALVMKRDEADALIRMLLTARDALWDLDDKPPKPMSTRAVCECPKCRAKRAAEAGQ